MSANDPLDAAWTPTRGLLRSVGWGLAAGVGMALIFFALVWFFQDAIRSTNFRIRSFTPRGGPLILLPFMLVSIVFGSISVRLAERISRLDTYVLMIPVLCSTAAALALCAVISHATIEPWSSKFWWVFLVSGVAMPVAAALRIWRSS